MIDYTKTSPRFRQMLDQRARRDDDLVDVAATGHASEPQERHYILATSEFIIRSWCKARGEELPPSLRNRPPPDFVGADGRVIRPGTAAYTILLADAKRRGEL